MNGFTDKGYVFLKNVYKKEELNKIKFKAYSNGS